MKLRELSRPSSGGRRRIAFWTRAGVAGAGALAVAAGALLGAAGGHRAEPLAHQQARVVPAPPMRLASIPQNHYWMVAADGGIFAFGAPFHGSTGNIRLNKPIVGMAATPDGGGYWFVASDGGIFNYGDAGFFNSLGATRLNSAIVGMAATLDGGGYWLVGGDGGVFGFGDATYYGGTGGRRIPAPIVGIAATPTGFGYWLVGADGSVYAFGDAGDFGDMSGVPLNAPVVGMAATPDGGGYWLVAADGGVFAFGDAGFFGSTGNIRLNKPIVGMTSSQTGRGYWFVASDGGLFAYGDAIFNGSMGATPLNQPMVGMAAQPVLFPARVGVVTSRPTVIADGTSQVTVTAESFAADGTPLPGDILGEVVDTAGCGSISPDAGITDLNGQVVSTYTSSTAVKNCSITAGEIFGPLSSSTSVSQVAGTPARIVGTPSTSTSYTADAGSSPGIPATFTVTDSFGNPVAGASVDFATTLAHGSVVPASATSNGSGVVTTVLHDTTVESGTVTATVHGTAVSGSTATISITAGRLDSLALTTPSGAAAGTPYTVTAHAFDHWGNATTPNGADFTVGGTACDASPSGKPAVCDKPSFSAGVADDSVTSYLAQKGATYTLSDSTGTYSGNAVVGTTTFDIAPGAPSKLTGTSAAFTNVQLADGTTPLGLFFQSFNAVGAQTATVTLTLTDAYGNVETGNSGALTVNLAHNASPNMSDNGTVTAPATLTNGVASFTYTAPDPSMTGGSYLNNWGNGSITWSMAGVTSAPASVPVTTTNVASMTNAVSGSSFTANQVDTTANGFSVTFKALPSGNGGPLGGVQVDWTETGFDGMQANNAFTDCNGNVVSSGVTAVPAGQTLNQVTVCPHPTKVNGGAATPQVPSTGVVTGWIDGAPTGQPTSPPAPNSVTSLITVNAGPLASVALSGAASNTYAAGSFTLNATAKDAEGNIVQPAANESFTAGFSKTETPTCGGVTQGAALTTPWSSGVGVFTVDAYVVNTGIVLTLTDSVTSGKGTYTFAVVPAAPATVSFSTVSTTFTADQGHAGAGYAVDVADAYCNAVGNQTVNLTTTLVNASEAQGGSPTPLPTSVTTGASTGNGLVLGRATFFIFDTTVQTGTLTATAGSGNGAPSATTPTITITPGKLSSFLLDTPGTQAVDTAYSVTVHAFDHWGNGANPTSATVVNSSSALSSAPDGQTPSVPSLGAFSNGVATVSGITSYLAQASAVLTVHDTTANDVYNGVAVNGSTSGYTINPGAISRIFAISSNPDYVASTATYTPTVAGETATFSLAIADDRGNAVSDATHNGDHIKVTLTGGTTPDGGSLSTPGQSATGADGPNSAVSLTVTLANGTGQFTYLGPGTPPLLTESGTITLTDLTHAGITGLPASIAISG